MTKALLKETIPRFGLPGSLQNDNDPAFVSQVTKGIVSALGIKWTLHSACQENWIKVLLTALLYMWLAPGGDKLNLNASELMNGRSIPQAQEGTP